jgi:von Willebrand factor type A domain
MSEFSKFKINVRGLENTVLVYDPSKESQTNLKELGALHHIHVIDRSGSMQGSLDRLIDDVQMVFNHIGEEDYLTVIWFSSDNQFRTVVKAAKKSDNIKKLLDTLRTTVGCTCFSDPMKEVGLVIEETYSLCSNVIVTLFTDGQPCCNRSSEEEIRLTLKNISTYTDKVLAINTVGYGNYYDQEFLKKISASSQYGTMIHTKRIEDYFKIFMENKESVTGMVNKKTEIVTDGSTIMYLGPNSCKTELEFMNQRQRSKTKNIYFVIHPDKVKVNGNKVDLSKVVETNDETLISDFAYAHAYQLYYNNERRMALNVVANVVRDKKLADSMMNAFTFDECAEVVENLKNALYKNARQPNTCPENYLPADDAPCVLQLLSELAGVGAKYVPFSKVVKQSYKRIGKKSEEKYTTFNRYESKEPLGDFSDLIYNEERLNVSIRFTIPGYVQLNPVQAKKVNFPDQIPTEIYRTHTIIKDGQLNLGEIEVVIPELSKGLVKFVDIGVVKCLAGDRYLVDLSLIPIINYAITESMDLNGLFETVLQISKLEAYQKVVKYHIDQVVENAGDEVKKTGIFSNLTEEQIKVLEEHGLSEKGYYKGFNISTPKAEDSDYYDARLMKFYMKGATALPSINKYLEAKAKKKVTTISLMLLDEAWTELEKMKLPSEATIEVKRILEKELKQIKKNLNEERTALNGVRISKALTNDWFPGLKTDEKGNYLFEHKSGETLILRADRTKVYFTAEEE